MTASRIGSVVSEALSPGSSLLSISSARTPIVLAAIERSVPAGGREDLIAEEFSLLRDPCPYPIVFLAMERSSPALEEPAAIPSLGGPLQPLLPQRPRRLHRQFRQLVRFPILAVA